MGAIFFKSKLGMSIAQPGRMNKIKNNVTLDINQSMDGWILNRRTDAKRRTDGEQKDG